MKWGRNRSGFTLVEIVMVLAISSLLLAGYLAGRGQLTQDASFTSAVDQAKNQVRQIQNEATHALSGSASSTGKTSTVIFGRLVEFKTDSRAQMQVSTLVGTQDNGVVTAIKKCPSNNVTLQNGVQYSGAQNKAVVFTRDPEKLFALNNPTETELPGASAIQCNGGTPEPAQVSTPNDSPCPAGESFRRAASGAAGGYCQEVKTAAPNVYLLDPDTGTAITGSTTSKEIIKVKVCSTAPNFAGVTVSFTANGGTPTSASSSSLDASGCYTWDWQFPNENIDYTITGFAQRAGSQISDGVPRTIRLTSGDPSSCTAAASLVNYKCGLKAEYFRGPSFAASKRQSVYIDTQVGSNLGNGGSSYGDFLPTLRARTSQPWAQFASVRWTGEIFIPAGTKQYCFNADDTAKVTIDGTLRITANKSNSCWTSSFSSSRWHTIQIDYANTGELNESSAYARLTFTGVGEVPGTQLRVAKTTTTQNPGNDPQQGVYYTYVRNFSWFGGGAFYPQNYQYEHGVGSGYTYGDWQYWVLNMLHNARPDLPYPGGDYMYGEQYGATVDSNIIIPHSGQYSFCSAADDYVSLQIDLNNNGGYDAGETLLAGGSSCWTGWANQGQYKVTMTDIDTCGCGNAYWFNPGNGMYMRFTVYDGGNYIGELNNTWFSLQKYYTTAFEPIKLPEGSQLAADITDKASQLDDPPKPKGLAGSIWQQVAAAADCDANILNPNNYSNSCSNWITEGGDSQIEIPITVNGDSTRNAKLILNHDTNTVTREFE